MSISRRQAIIGFTGGIAGLYAAGAFRMGNRSDACATELPKTPYDALPVKVEKLTDTVSVLSGPGGNMTAVLAEGQKVLIDSGLQGRASDVVAAATALDAKPVNTVINTHHHFDHVGGNAAFAATGSHIIAHENTRKRLSTRQTNAFMGMEFDPYPKSGWPTTVFQQALTVFAGDQALRLLHVEPAHTDNDVIIHLPDSDVLLAGDTFFNGFFPFIDYDAGGSIEGMIAAGEKMMSMTGPKTRIVPGHGPVGTAVDLSKFVQMLRTANERVSAAVASGATEEQAVSQNLLKDLDPAWGQRMFTPSKFVVMLYRGKKAATAVPSSR